MSDDWRPWPVCPADDCGETEGVEIMELIPGRTYTTTGLVCHHVAFLFRKPDTEMPDEERKIWEEFFRTPNVPRETSVEHHDDETLIDHFEKCVPGGAAAMEQARKELGTEDAPPRRRRSRKVPRETSRGDQP